LQRLK